MEPPFATENLIQYGIARHKACQTLITRALNSVPWPAAPATATYADPPAPSVRRLQALLFASYLASASPDGCPGREARDCVREACGVWRGLKQEPAGGGNSMREFDEGSLADEDEDGGVVDAELGFALLVSLVIFLPAAPISPVLMLHATSQLADAAQAVAARSEPFLQVAAMPPLSSAARSN